LIKNCGLDPSSTTKAIGLVVASQANFYASASYPNLITAGLTVSKIGKSSVTYRVGIFESENLLACVVGGFTHVFVNNQDRRPVTQLPEEIITGVRNIIE
jgi:acyl-CoA thioester hydrolase